MFQISKIKYLMFAMSFTVLFGQRASAAPLLRLKTVCGWTALEASNVQNTPAVKFDGFLLSPVVYVERLSATRARLHVIDSSCKKETALARIKILKGTVIDGKTVDAEVIDNVRPNTDRKPLVLGTDGRTMHIQLQPNNGAQYLFIYDRAGRTVVASEMGGCENSLTELLGNGLWRVNSCAQLSQ